jgi:hypothetical protein
VHVVVAYRVPQITGSFRGHSDLRGVASYCLFSFRDFASLSILAFSDSFLAFPCLRDWFSSKIEEAPRSPSFRQSESRMPGTVDGRSLARTGRTRPTADKVITDKWSGAWLLCILPTQFLRSLAQYQSSSTITSEVVFVNPLKSLHRWTVVASVVKYRDFT